MKKIIQFLTAIAVVFLTNSAWADWTRFSALENDSIVIYIDQESLKIEGTIVRFWQLYDLKVADSRGRKSYRSVVELDCKESKIRNLQDEYFSDNMARGVFMGSSLTSNEWKFIAPGTLPMMLFKGNCSSK